MPLSREISQPIGHQPAHVVSWKESLRDLAGSPTPKAVRNRSPSPTLGTSGYVTDVQRDNSGLKSSGKKDKLRLSTGNLAASFNKSTSGKSLSKSVELAGIEQEYIKNLQQQVYFLELEANYLREQARKATEMHPVMTAEAERMLTKLRQMQTEIEGLRMDLNHKDGSIDVVNAEKARYLDRIRSLEDNHGREKRLLMDDIVNLKKEKALLERDISGKALQITQSGSEKVKNATDIRTLEQKAQLLHDQVDHANQQTKLTQIALDEKRAELVRTENKLRDVEEKYYSSSMTIQDKVTREFKDEIADLRRKLKEAEYAADQERHLRNKISDDNGTLLKENSLLTQQAQDLHNQVLRERTLRESWEGRRSADVGELLASKDLCNQLQLEVSSLMEQLAHENDRGKHYMDQLTKKEQLEAAASVSLASAQSRLNELETFHLSTDTENSQLRRDKMLLVDHVTELQKQLDAKDADNSRLMAHVQAIEKRLGDFERQKLLESSLQSRKWGELENLADSMKYLSHNMSKSPLPDQ